MQMWTLFINILFVFLPPSHDAINPTGSLRFENTNEPREEKEFAACELENVFTGSEADCFVDRGSMEGITSGETFNATLW